MNDKIKSAIDAKRADFSECLSAYLGIDYSPAIQLSLILISAEFLGLKQPLGDLVDTLAPIIKKLDKRGRRTMEEVALAAYIDFKLSSIENPTVHDYYELAYAIGFAEHALLLSLRERTNKRRGGNGRAAKIAEQEVLVMECVKKIGGWEERSAEELAGDVLGIQGITFGHRKIADTIREHRKILAVIEEIDNNPPILSNFPH